MTAEIRQPIEAKLDEYFRVEADNTGRWFRVKMPWNKSHRWLKAEVYYNFRSDLVRMSEEQANDRP